MSIMLPPRRLALCAAICLVLLVPGPASAAGIPTYLALGDSLAFGFGDSTTPSYGDRGYVGDYANYLGTETGVRPFVDNLGVYGETTSSFFNGSPASRFVSPNASGVSGDTSSTLAAEGTLGATMNLNYSNDTTSQNSLMLSTIASAKASGDPINTVSVQLGANDLFAVANQPGFSSLSATQQSAEITQALGTVATNVATLLGELKSQLPNANVLVMGYYNPYAAVPSNPFAPLAAEAIPALNGVLKAVAQQLGDNYVDTYTPFLGNEAAYTYITSSGTQYNVHPNDTGYQVIADQMAEVPEPSTALVLGAGVAGLLAARRRRAR